ncbi:MAG: LamG-like jellyroll fold domain-containing protein, partial [Planctomycetota bacterium]
EAEILECKKRGIEYFAFWDEHPAAFALFKKYGLSPQIWKTLGSPPGATQAERVKKAAEALLPSIERARKIGSRFGLYNHGRWGGEPKNLVAVCEYLRRVHDANHVGIVYNLHHGHGHIDDFSEVLEEMSPYLLCLNLNGMVRGASPKILQLGQGEHELGLLRKIVSSSYRGPIGVIGHTQDDVELRLRDNLEGLDWLLPQLRGFPAGAKPVPKTPTGLPKAIVESVPSLSDEFGRALEGGWVEKGRASFRTRPITIECRAKLRSKSKFNILVASDEKSSADHWELYTYSGTGCLSLYQPGRGGEFQSEVNICDGRWHALAAVIQEKRVRLYVDGKLVLDQSAAARRGEPRAGGFAIGRLVEGSIGCDGSIDDVRLSRGVRAISAPSESPMTRDDRTIGLWDFDRSVSLKARPARDPWAAESAEERAKLPPFRIAIAAKPSELSKALVAPDDAVYETWFRSHGGDASSRYSSLKEIHRGNVAKLKIAWTYHSGDGKGNIQCNPIVVDGTFYGPTVGGHIVALDAATGDLRWKFRADRRPAFRGITYWPGGFGVGPRLFFATEGRRLYCLDPKSGRPIGDFGQGGWVVLREGARVAAA